MYRTMQSIWRSGWYPDVWSITTVAFAIRLGIVDNQTGQQLMADLEKDLNQLYSEVYEDQRTPDIGKEA